MRRREAIALIGGAVAAWPAAVRGQQVGKVWRIGMLETASAELNAVQLDAFRQGLRELGYIEGRNLLIDYRSADGHPERFPPLAADLVRLRVDLITSRGTPAAEAAKAATATVPVVIISIGDPLRIVTSLARPGGNITGLSSMVLDLQGKLIELLKETVPRLTRVAGLMNMSNPVIQPEWRETEAAARSVGLETQLLDIRKVDDLEPALAAAIRLRADALVVGTDTLTQSNAKLISDLAAKSKLPTIFPVREFVVAGGLMSYGASRRDVYRRAATYVDKIFKGAKPADLPVEQPTKFELVINLNAAKAIGLTVPSIVLARADEVIE
jgi:putative ABC transport system substrate-binding protein